ncbi:MAG TPA: hypothetical protein VLA35_11510 [Thermoleophilia bacterium]|nr:hypothetical protein [Thermoleophilia bacterium]
MRVGQKDVRTLRSETAVGRRHTVAAKALLVIALVLFTILWLLLAPGTAAAL